MASSKWIIVSSLALSWAPKFSLGATRLTSQSKVESFIPTGTGSGGDYHRQGSDHWSELPVYIIKVVSDPDAQS